MKQEHIEGLQLPMLSVTIDQRILGSETIIDMARVMEGALKLAAEKNANYGDAWKAQGWMGNLARIMSKTARLKAMLWRSGGTGRPIGDESVEDTTYDLINLGVFFLLNKGNENKWGPDA